MPALIVYDATIRPNCAGSDPQRKSQLGPKRHHHHEIDDAGELNRGQDQEQHQLTPPHLAGRRARRLRPCRQRIFGLHLVVPFGHSDSAVLPSDDRTSYNSKTDSKGAKNSNGAATDRPSRRKGWDSPLRQGEDLFTSGDGLRMLGAVYSLKQCVACHGGERGDLLGALSYRLERDSR